jgi:two-component system cell cycle response regulator
MITGRNSSNLVQGDPFMNHNEKILVIEEQKESRDRMCRLLEKEGYRVLEAGDCSSGLQKIISKQPDLILLDIFMPQGEGIKLCRTIKDDPKINITPVLMTTFDNQKDDLERCREAGADAFIIKPIDETDFLYRIHSSLRWGGLLGKLDQENRDLMAILEISNTITSTLESQKVLYAIVKKISESIDVSRCSIVRVDTAGEKGVVVASSEGPEIINLEIDLTKYPEVVKALNTRDVVAVNNIHTDPLVAPVRDTLEILGVHSLLVLPVLMRQNVIGTILLRTARKDRHFEEREIRFCKIITSAAANALINAALFEDMEMVNINLEWLATTDGLTGIYNHRHFYTRLEQEVDRSVRYQLPLSIVMIDLDNFKALNDTYGHRIGDAVLKEFAHLLKKETRKSDFIARYGGDEFALILPQTDGEGAKCEAGRIMKAVCNHRFSMIEEATVRISYGVAAFSDEKINHVDNLVRVADQALYSMKKKNRNTVAPYQSTIMPENQ